MSTFLTDKSNPTSDAIVLGKSALLNDLSSIGQITRMEMTGCMVNHLFVTSDTTSTPTTTIPVEDWGNDYIFNADYTESADGGNAHAVLDGLQRLLFKRRVKGDDRVDAWKTILTYEVTDPAVAVEELRDLFIKDYLGRDYESYEYAIVPVVKKDGKIITATIDDAEEYPSVDSKFEYTFISDGIKCYKLYANVGLGTATNQQLIGVHDPLGSQYPIVVSNSNINYMSGTLSGTVLNEEFYKGDYIFDRYKLVKAREELQEFLSNKKPKIIKDWNGNIWLVQISGTPTYTFNDEWGMGMADVSIPWVELGSLDDQETLDKMNLVVYTGGGGDTNGGYTLAKL